MALTAEQRELWDSLRLQPPRPSGGQTPEQARSSLIFGFRQACSLEGIAIPSGEDVAAELDKLAD